MAEQTKQKTGFCDSCDERGGFKGSVLDSDVRLIVSRHGAAAWANLSRDTTRRGRDDDWQYSSPVESTDPRFVNLADLGDAAAHLLSEASKEAVANCRGKVDGRCPALCATALVGYQEVVNERRTAQIERVVDDYEAHVNCADPL